MCRGGLEWEGGGGDGVRTRGLSVQGWVGVGGGGDGVKDPEG